ncbi:MAG: hypothetical protein P4N60_09810 [Verrucomicrobiae bacterium]|nr:hypothetical protein [Verrucomicrobiae bacterium]
MKRHLLLLTVGACFVLHSAMAATNLLSIHLVVEKVFPQWHPGSMPKPDSLTLVSPPVLADGDFVSFDATNQTFTITPGAARRLAAGLRGGAAPILLNGGVYDQIPDTAPFVLQAAGEPIYVGAFYTLVSSSAFAGPVILPDTMFISPHLTNNVTFRIELGYPGTSPGLADPRRDPRIVAAVQKLFAHEKK